MPTSSQLECYLKLHCVAAHIIELALFWISSMLLFMSKSYTCKGQGVLLCQCITKYAFSLQPPYLHYSECFRLLHFTKNCSENLVQIFSQFTPCFRNQSGN